MAGSISFDDPPGFANIAEIQLDATADALNVLSGGNVGTVDIGFIAMGTATATFFTTFSLFSFPPYVGAGPYPGPATFSNGVLPITLLSYGATVRNDAVEIKWVTASEVNNDFFSIERSSDSERFETVGNAIKGKGITAEKSTYKTVDESPLYGRSYYRLKQTDFDGKFTYSNVVAFNFEGPRFSSLKAFPNPSSGDNVTVVLEGITVKQEIPVIVYNVQGQKVFEEVLQPSAAGVIKRDL